MDKKPNIHIHISSKYC